MILNPTKKGETDKALINKESTETIRLKKAKSRSKIEKIDIMTNIVIIIIKDTMKVMIESIEKIEELDKNQKIDNIKGADNVSIEDMIQEREEEGDLEDNIKGIHAITIIEDNIKEINAITIIESTKIITEIDPTKLEKRDRGNKMNDA